MDFNISRNTREVRRGLNDVARRQIPFATSLAINEVLGDIRKNWEKALRKGLDRPTPFTMKAFAMRRATKRSLTGAVFAKRIQNDYLTRLEDGGTRQPKRRAILVPVGLRLNKYGNMPRGAVKRTVAKPKTFSGRPKGRSAAGIWERRAGNKLRLLIHYADRARYSSRLKLIPGAAKTATARLPGAMLKAMRRALGSAR